MNIAPQMPIKFNPYYLINPGPSYSMLPDVKLFKLGAVGIIIWLLDRVGNFGKHNLNPFQYFRIDSDTGLYACIIEREIWFGRITAVHNPESCVGVDVGFYLVYFTLSSFKQVNQLNANIWISTKNWKNWYFDIY